MKLPVLWVAPGALGVPNVADPPPVKVATPTVTPTVLVTPTAWATTLLGLLVTDIDGPFRSNVVCVDLKLWSANGLRRSSDLQLHHIMCLHHQMSWMNKCI